MAKKPVNKTKLVNHHAIAQMLGMHPDSIHRLVEKKSGIPHTREHFGIAGRSRIRFNPTDVQNWVSSRTNNFEGGKNAESG